MNLRHGEKCYSKDRSCDTLWKRCKAVLSIVQWLEVLIAFTKSLFPPSCVLCKSGCIVSSSFRWDVMLCVSCLDNLPVHSNLPACAKHRIGDRLYSKEDVLAASPSHIPHLEICASYVCFWRLMLGSQEIAWRQNSHFIVTFSSHWKAKVIAPHRLLQVLELPWVFEQE